MVGFALDPNFRVNGYFYLLYVVDRHHLLNFGTGSYNSTSNQYYAATIGRLTRYTCRSADGFRSVDSASRLILIGATKSTGIPIFSYTHGVGSLVFGEDGTLLVSTGDAGSPNTADLGGNVDGTYAPSGTDPDGILKTKENVGAYRSQLVDCLNGKILRIDPTTGLGLPSNPFYEVANPGSARSRVWALGLRNPFRMSLKAGTGSHSSSAGNPGVLYVGDVGWNNLESLKVVTGPRQNFGWPLYEGLDLTPGYNVNVANQDAPNPLYPGGSCTQYFSFRDLLKEDTLNPAGQPPFANPCNSSQKIPSSIPQFLHARPVLDWAHWGPITRTPIYDPSGQAKTANVGAAGSPVSGVQFQGNCSAGGIWYTGTSFPAQYQNSFYLAEWGVGEIKRVTFDQNHKPVSVANFLSNGGFIASVAMDPTDGSLYYCTFDYSSSVVRKLTYAGNRTPVAAAAADKYFGPGPLTVQFNSSGSSDPDGQAITYSWNFGDGTPVSTQANPAHTFTAPAGVPTGRTVTLTVTDSGGLSAQVSLKVAVNGTPPAVTILSPTNGLLYPPGLGTNVHLIATVNDLESSDAQLSYQWQTLLQHNEHYHGSPPDTNHVTTAVISPTTCDGINVFYYRVILTVTDPQGLATTREVQLFPICGPNTPPTLTGIGDQTVNQDTSTSALGFTVGDAESAVGSLVVTGSSSNPTLVPNGNIVFGGSGANRTVTVSPAANQSGTVTITINVSDGQYSVSTNFELTVGTLVTGANSFTNSAAITIPSQGAVTPYPSTINVTGLNGTISNLTVTLRNITHTWPDDLDILLVDPTGQKVMVFSDVGGDIDVSNFTVTLSDAATTALPDNGPLVAGTFKPTDAAPGEVRDLFPTPAPAGPYGTSLADFNGLAANGVWSLYVNDDGNGDAGTIAGGWSLTIFTTEGVPAAPTITEIADQATTMNMPTAVIPFTVLDADTPVGNLTLSGTSSNLPLVPLSNIVFGGSGANRKVTVTPLANQTGVVTITVTVSDGQLSSSNSFELIVSTSVTGTMSFTNSAAITIPSQGAVTLYPSTINVNGTGGTISNLTVTLRNITHTWPDDLDILLVDPTGQKVMIFSDVGGDIDVSNLTVSLSDAATAALPDNGPLVAGTFKPTDAAPGELRDLFPTPAPAGPYRTNLADFNGLAANGVWSLYVNDDGTGDAGTIAGGWSLTITTHAVAGTNPVSIQITSITIDAQGAVQVTISGEVGLSYALEASSEVSNWTTVDVQENVTGSIVFNDQPTNSARFYRAVSIPR